MDKSSKAKDEKKISDVAPRKTARTTKPIEDLVIPNRSIIPNALDQSNEPAPVVASAKTKTVAPMAKKTVEITTPTESAPSAENAETPSTTTTENTPPPTTDPEALGEPADTNTPPANEKDSEEKKRQEEISQAVKRERELQEYINTKKYFVPINSAHKRSIKISFGLTFLAFLLALTLVDLMLDTGVIYLVQKIPHTHFFDIYKN